VEEFARNLIVVEAVKGFSVADCNFLYLGKTLDHSQSFVSQNVQNEAKILMTVKKGRASITPS